MVIPEEVAPLLKAQFSAFVDQRTAKGIKTYGTPLMTFNGRTNNDALEEILDFAQYQEQYLMEAEALLQAVMIWLEGTDRAESPAIAAWLKKRGLP